jgi:hypothetical protein
MAQTNTGLTLVKLRPACHENPRLVVVPSEVEVRAFFDKATLTTVGCECDSKGHIRLLTLMGEANFWSRKYGCVRWTLTCTGKPTWNNWRMNENTYTVDTWGWLTHLIPGVKELVYFSPCD